MDPWRTSIVDSRDGHIRIRGYDVPSLMTGRTFTDTIFLLHQGRLPNGTERALLDAILTGVADHGSGAPSCATARLALSGNRQSVSAAVAAGILAVGDDHGGAGSGCMEMIAAGLARAKAESLSLDDAARRSSPNPAPPASDWPVSAIASTPPIREPASCSISRGVAASPVTASRSSKRWSARSPRSSNRCRSTSMERSRRCCTTWALRRCLAGWSSSLAASRA